MKSPSVDAAKALVLQQADLEYTEYFSTSSYFNVMEDGVCVFVCNTDPSSASFYKEKTHDEIRT